MSSPPRRTILQGYRVDEVKLPDIWPINNKTNNNEVTLDPSVRIRKIRQNDRNERRPVAGSLGMHLDGAACPHPDMNDTNTTLAGALYRFCPKIPGYDDHKPAFRAFVKNWIEKNMTPLAPDTDTSVEAWLEKTSYTLTRKEELLRKYRNIRDQFDPQHRKIKSFVKDEFYPDFKHARAINSRADEFKCLVGPIFQLIGDRLFARPEFIKKIPVHERPDYLIKSLWREGGKYICTDFSSFEAHFRRVIMEDCEFQLYDYMTQFLPDHDTFMRHVREGIGGTNFIEFKNILMEIDAKRMSGEMNTSLGNGFANLMFILYICSITPGCEDVVPRVEGDDSVSACSGVAPTTEDFKNFGLRIKLETFDDLCKASFCGMVFDIEERTNISDPREILATFGWTSSRYINSKASVHKTLLRCKALSLAYQYPACPILSALAKRVLYLTRSHEVSNFVAKQGKFLYNQYDIELFKIAEMRNRQKLLLFQEPGPKTRSLVEELYGIPVNAQLEMEKYFDQMEEIVPISSSLFLDFMPSTWKSYYENYSFTLSPKSQNFEYPTQLWIQNSYRIEYPTKRRKT